MSFLLIAVIHSIEDMLEVHRFPYSETTTTTMAGFAPKRPSATSNSLSSSPASSSNSSLTQHDQVTIQTLTECLHKLHSLQEQESRIRKGSGTSSPSTKTSVVSHRKPAASGPRRLKRLALNLNLAKQDSIDTNESEVIRDHQDKDDSGLDPDQLEVIEQLANDRVQLLEEAVDHTTVLREDTTRQISPAVKSRASKLMTEMQLSVDASGERAFDLPYLFGRCFNLSLNLKILSQCDYADPSIAARIFADFDMLENSLGIQVEAIKKSQADAAIMEDNFARLQF